MIAKPFLCRNAACMFECACAGEGQRLRAYRRCVSQRAAWAEEGWGKNCKTTTSSDRRLPAFSGWEEMGVKRWLSWFWPLPPPPWLPDTPTLSFRASAIRKAVLFLAPPVPFKMSASQVCWWVTALLHPWLSRTRLLCASNRPGFCSTAAAVQMCAPPLHLLHALGTKTRSESRPRGSAARSSTNAGLQTMACHERSNVLFMGEFRAGGGGGGLTSCPQQEMELPSSPLCCHNPELLRHGLTNERHTRPRRFPPPWPVRAQPENALILFSVWIQILVVVFKPAGLNQITF